MDNDASLATRVIRVAEISHLPLAENHQLVRAVSNSTLAISFVFFGLAD
jgi:type III secretion system FlhB-like substrate exporter